MNNQHTNKPYTKEKEHALSLLRIPINFFEENDSEIKANSNPDKLKVNTSASSKSSSKNNIDLEDLTNGTKNINVEVELSPSAFSKNSVVNTNMSELDSNSESQESAKISGEKTTSPQAEAKTSTSQKGNTPPPPTTNVPPQKTPSETSSTPAAPSPAQSPSPSQEKPKPKTTPSDEKPQKEDAPSTSQTPSASPTGKKKDDTPKQSDDGKRHQEKFGKKKPDTRPNINSKKNKPNTTPKEKINLPNQLAAKNPNLGKNLNKLQSAQQNLNKLKDAANNADPEGATEAVLNTGLDAAETALEASGHAWASKAIKFVRQTEVGDKIVKVASKAVVKTAKLTAKITCVGCLTIPLLIMGFVIALSSITGFYDMGHDDYSELSEAEYEKIQEATFLYSMAEYIELVKNARDTFKYPILTYLQEYLDNYYEFTEEMANDYTNEYKDLIDQGYLMPVKAGDPTNFGLAFETLKKNYSVANLKAPSSAPERQKEVDGKMITYTTYDPTGIHQALFEEVLNGLDDDFETLKNRFSGQVDPAWFDELKELLEKKFPVYIEGLDSPEAIDNPPERSLEELFKETSRQLYDTEYYTALINTAFTTYSKTNKDIIEAYRGKDGLVDRLCMLELMTYMLSYQKFYTRIEEFKMQFTSPPYANLDMFTEEFFAQFLTFSKVEYFLALSTLSDHSLTYEIAIASIEASSNNIERIDLTTSDVTKLYLGIEKYDNWYATFYLNPEIHTSSSGEVVYSISPVIKKTQIQQFLFDKYNVEKNVFDNHEWSDGQNQNAFFAAFELATGIDMSIMDDEGGNQTPIYQLDINGVISGTTVPLATADNKSLPLSSATLARVSIGFNQPYSDATTSKLGMPKNKRHTGIDYAVSSGTTVLAAAPGTATVVRGNTGFGNYVKLTHDNGYTSFYAHGNGTFYITNGQKVSAGQPIMQSGNSGNSTGAHLHFEVRNSSGKSINPHEYITQSA